MKWLAAYLVERFPLGVFAPAILLLSITAWLSTATATPTSLANDNAAATGSGTSAGSSAKGRMSPASGWLSRKLRE